MKKMAFLLFNLSIFVFLVVSGVSSQSTPDNPRITVDAAGIAYVSADILHFQVNITQFSRIARQAFNSHKEQEQFLTQLLLEEEIPDSNITANPINISHIRRNNETGESGYETRQQILITLGDTDQFESMQLKLIENGFTNFSGSFSSTLIDKASNEALQKAVNEARRKADLLAEAAGKRISDVLSINYHTSRPYAARNGIAEMAAYDVSSGSLLQFEHTIPVQENVTIQYLIE